MQSSTVRRSNEFVMLDCWSEHVLCMPLDRYFYKLLFKAGSAWKMGQWSVRDSPNRWTVQLSCRIDFDEIPWRSGRTCKAIWLNTADNGIFPLEAFPILGSPPILRSLTFLLSLLDVAKQQLRPKQTSTKLMDVGKWNWKNLPRPI